MERKTIFLALFSAFVACFFVACSNDSDALDINAIDIKAGTRSVGLSSYMTREEIQDRLDEIGEKYGTRVIIDKTVDIDLITEDIFTDLEEHLSSPTKNDKKFFTECITDTISLLLDDSSVDEIMPIAEQSSGEIMYSGDFNVTVRYQCINQQNQSEEVVSNVTISWTTGEGNPLGLSARIDTGHGNNVQISYSNLNGNIQSPSFDYLGTIECITTALVPSYEFVYDEKGGISDVILIHKYETFNFLHYFTGSYPIIQ